MHPEQLDLDTAKLLLDFSGGHKDLESLGELQLLGAVALYNSLAREDIRLGYLADEVGMGKTYIALGVVALMRYFNPSLRVLYICPSGNVQEKWHREYRSFIRDNVLSSAYRVRTIDGRSAAPAVTCNNLDELIHAAASGYYADFFVRKGSFSFGLPGKTERGAEPDQASAAAWERLLAKLERQLPAHVRGEEPFTKQGVKDQFARALNYVLPSFDLVIIDEAHNFKHDFDSSDRNRLLSRALGFRSDDTVSGITVPRAQRALLLSATPYDRDLEQLRNQLRMVGREELLTTVDNDSSRGEVADCLGRFMVRRLNQLEIDGRPHTRNMYRKEWRKGPEAEVPLASDETKLVTALVQKKLGDLLGHKHGSPSFQMGMLASFESYAQSVGSHARSNPEFDDDGGVLEERQARDRAMIDGIVASYKAARLGESLPHPKMDEVADRLARQMFEYGRKQLVFVRRVRSVHELKQKLDERYDRWLTDYLWNQVSGYPDAEACVRELVSCYEDVARDRERSIGEGVAIDDGDGEEAKAEPKKDNLFNWFFRGPPGSRLDGEPWSAEVWVTPEQTRSSLIAKDDNSSQLLEINWALVLHSTWLGEMQASLESGISEIARRAGTYGDETVVQEAPALAFRIVQLAFIEHCVESTGEERLRPLAAHLRSGVQSPVVPADPWAEDRVRSLLFTQTLFSRLIRSRFDCDLLPRLREVLEALQASGAADSEPPTPSLFRRMEVHHALFLMTLRTGHGAVDLYLSRLRAGAGKLSTEMRQRWMRGLVARLRSQRKSPGRFSTYLELHGIADQFDALLKANLPDILEQPPQSDRRFINDRLRPISPMLGATGETNGPGQRAAQARKFRMPGYPLALVSTNVFQEGDDLHLFCDSVTHYGISGSPVDIEQKNGRVDRVGSMAQRRLLHHRTSQPSDTDLIQVSFPHVRESIELLQVRRLCRNINDFISSLHDITGGDTKTETVLDSESAISDPSDVPEQIMHHLQSPYAVNPPTRLEHSPSDNVIVHQQETGDVPRRTGEAVRAALFERLIEDEGAAVISWPLKVGIDGRGEIGGGGLSQIAEVDLLSARASGYMLLSIKVAGPAVSIENWEALSRQMEDFSWRTFCRALATQEGEGYRMSFDAELLISPGKVPQASEVEMLLDRFMGKHDPGYYQSPKADTLATALESLERQKQPSKGARPAIRMNVQPPLPNSGRPAEVRVRIGALDSEREQVVSVWEFGPRVIVLSEALSVEEAGWLSVQQLIERTWERNSRTDLVEFMLSPTGALVGRMVHPKCGVDADTMNYCIRHLVAEVARLRYLVVTPDLGGKTGVLSC